MMKICILAACAATAMGAAHTASGVPEMSTDAKGINVALPSGGDFTLSRYDEKTAKSADIADAQKGIMTDMDSIAAGTKALKTMMDGVKNQMDGVETLMTEKNAKEGDHPINVASEAVFDAKRDQTKTRHAVEDTLAEQQIFINNQIKEMEAAADKLIKEEMEKFTKELTEGKKELDKTLKTLDASEKESKVIGAAADKLTAALAKHENCAATKQIYHASSNKCIDANIPATAFIPKVAHAMFNNGDGREGGYVNSRVVKVKKTVDESYLRVFWYDNLRVHGHTAHGRWHVYICDKNGNGCAECRNPGRLNAWK
jgi:hypothetical protein